MNNIEKIEPFVLPEKWCIKVTNQDYNLLKEYYNKLPKTKWVDGFGGFGGMYYTFWLLSDPDDDESYQYWSSIKPVKYEEITLDQFKEYVLNKPKTMKRITGYKLIKEYPSSAPLGYISDITNVSWNKYPEFWEPIYEDQFKVGDIVMTRNDEIFTINSVENNYLIPVEDFSRSYPLSSVRLATEKEKEEYRTLQEKRKQEIIIANEFAEILNDAVRFGCQIITLRELEAVESFFKLCHKLASNVHYSLVADIREGKVDSLLVDRLIAKIKAKAIVDKII